LFFGEEVACGFLDGGEIVEIEVQEFEGAFGVREGGLDRFDCFCGFAFGSSGNVDAGVVGVEDLGEFFAYSA
jgi:hypothetical protein